MGEDVTNYRVIVAGEEVEYEAIALYCESLPDGDDGIAYKFKPGRIYTQLDTCIGGSHLILGAPKRTQAEDGTVTLEYASWEQA